MNWPGMKYLPYRVERVADVCAHAVVSGLVQGVAYRWFAVRAASTLEVRGWVKNLRNGNVEVLAEGERGPVEAFLKEMRIGPRSAVVRDVLVEWRRPTGEYAGFDVRY